MYTVTLCCSKRFKKEERAFAKDLRKLGINVYEPPLHSPENWDDMEKAVKLAYAAGATHRHFHKIRKSDAIFVVNPGGYAGPSTSMEIGYAAALDKKIFMLEEDPDYPRRILIDGIAKTPKELIKLISKVQTPDMFD